MLENITKYHGHGTHRDASFATIISSAFLLIILSGYKLLGAYISFSIEPADLMAILLGLFGAVFFISSRIGFMMENASKLKLTLVILFSLAVLLVLR